MSADDAPPSPWQSCTCGHLAMRHEADEHGAREGCTVTVEAAEDGAIDLQCPCRQFEVRSRSTQADIDLVEMWYPKPTQPDPGWGDVW